MVEGWSARDQWGGPQQEKRVLSADVVVVIEPACRQGAPHCQQASSGDESVPSQPHLARARAGDSSAHPMQVRTAMACEGARAAVAAPRPTTRRRGRAAASSERGTTGRDHDPTRADTTAGPPTDWTRGVCVGSALVMCARASTEARSDLSALFLRVIIATHRSTAISGSPPDPTAHTAAAEQLPM